MRSIAHCDALWVIEARFLSHPVCIALLPIARERVEDTVAHDPAQCAVQKVCHKYVAGAVHYDARREVKAGASLTICEALKGF